MRRLFVFGCARSGTSVLGELIASHPAVTYVFEAHSVWEQGGQGPDECHRLTREHATDPVKHRIRRWFQSQSRGCGFVAEKNPRNVLRVPFVREIFPEAVFVHIVRDGRDVACSMIPGCGGAEWQHLKPPGWKGMLRDFEGVVRCAHVWKEAVELGLADLEGLDHQRIRYEDLVRDPFSTAAGLFRRLGLEWHPSVADYCRLITNDTRGSYHAKGQDHWYRDDHRVRIGRWQENLSEREQREVTGLLRPLLEDLGYLPQAPLS